MLLLIIITFLFKIEAEIKNAFRLIYITQKNIYLFFIDWLTLQFLNFFMNFYYLLLLDNLFFNFFFLELFLNLLSLCFRFSYY